MKVYKILALSVFTLITGNLISQINPAKTNSQKPTTTISFESQDFNWGEMEAGEKVQNVFNFVNDGDHPLVISNAKGSCGCTVPSWPKEPIMPGESAEILVQFDSKNKKGLQSKRVTISANTEPAMTYLTLNGTVLKVEEKKKEGVKKAGVKKETNADIDPSSVNVYPNPTTAQINIDLKEYEGERANIEVYDFKGSKIEQKSIVALSQETIIFDTAHYAEGTYVVVVQISSHNRLAKQFTVSK